MQIEKKNKSLSGESSHLEFPEYEPPKIVTYTSDQILEQIGPAMACSSAEIPGG